MSAPEERVAEQRRLVLTPDPLQRVGAFALAALANAANPRDLGPGEFQGALGEVRRLAESASVKQSKEPGGFWQKVSLGYVPNSPVNHPGRYKGSVITGPGKQDKRAKTGEDVRAAVRRWLTMPEVSEWPQAGCALCGREAVGFYGKKDVVLAESEAYLNLSPRGHLGVALCWPCLVSFYALPFGCRLTGGQSSVLFSWEETVLARFVTREVPRNLALAETGDGKRVSAESKEQEALRALRALPGRMGAGVELLVFNNNNQPGGQFLTSFGVGLPLAEWLRSTGRMPRRRRAFGTLVRVHYTATSHGFAVLAGHVFKNPGRIVATGGRGLARLLGQAKPDFKQTAELADLLLSFATEVMQVNERDLAEIRTTARHIAVPLAKESGRGPLRQLRMRVRNPAQLRGWLTKEATAWAGREQNAAEGTFITPRALLLLCDPGSDNAGWLHRDLLLICVLEELAKAGWKSQEEPAPEDEVAEMDEQDRRLVDENEEEDQ